MMQSASATVREVWPEFWRGQWAPHIEGAGPGYGPILRQVIQPWSDLYSAWFKALRQATWPSELGWDWGCPRCRRDDCRCRCCVGSADLLVRARVGERRIVPIVIENAWRRQREVELELSSWSSAEFEGQDHR